MKKGLIIFFCCIAAVLAAEDLISFTTKDGREYKNVKISSFKSDSITVISDSGVAKILISNLPDELREKCEQKAIQTAANIDDRFRAVVAGLTAVGKKYTPDETDINKLQEGIRSYRKISQAMLMLISEQHERRLELEKSVNSIDTKISALEIEMQKKNSSKGTSGKDDWIKVAEWSGKQGRQTESVKISGPEYRVEWNYKGSGSFGIVVYRNGKYEKLIVNTIGSTAQDTILRGSGDVYLDIRTDNGQFTVWLDDRK